MKYNTDDILNSLAGLKRAEAPGQFYASLRAKMARQQQEEPARARLSLRPVFVAAVLFIFLTANIFVLTGRDNSQKNVQSENDATGIRAFSEAYNLNAQSFVQ